MSDKFYTFAGGVDEVVGYGQRSQILFSPTWSVGDTWSLEFASTIETAFRLGAGALIVDVNKNNRLSFPNCCFTYKNRVYLGLGSQFNFSDNGDPTGWEEQNPGAGSILYLSQTGGQDTIGAFSQLQGRLAVLARRSIQLWTVSADPSQFALVQTLDNIGTGAPLGLANLGDFDVIFLDDTGIRSLRSREVTLNAFIDDLGTQIDPLVQADIVSAGVAGACAIVAPDTKDYWLFISQTLYVFSRHPASKISAWGTYLMTDTAGATFAPQKFVILNGIVWTRAIAGGLYSYGGAAGTTYDTTQVTVETPWHDNKKPATLKLGVSVDVVMSGAWTVKASMDPHTGTLEQVYTGGSAGNPKTSSDSTFDGGRIPLMTMGTHYKLQAVSANNSSKYQTLSAFIFKDKRGELV